MKPDSGVQLFHGGEERIIAVLVERKLDRVLFELHAKRTQFPYRTGSLPGRILRVPDGCGGGEACEAVRMPPHDLSHLLIVAANEIGEGVT